jgi:ferredoxin
MEIDALQGESILAAMERHQVSTKLGVLTDPPSECRRGNCLTCTAAATLKAPEIGIEGKRTLSMALRSDDGLSPSLSEWVARRGYVLTCSTYVVGPGVAVELGVNHDAWQDVYKNRLEGEATQLAARKAFARVIRKNAERNVDEWRRGTEQVLLDSPSVETDESSLLIDEQGV